METERKTIGATIKAAGDDGSFEAVIATFGVVDKDGDVVEPGAFGDHPVSVLPAHDQQHVPLGKATIEERGELAVAVGMFNLDIAAARDWHSALKFDLANIAPPVQEWSWGFRPTKAAPGSVDGTPVRRLIEVEQREISPVLRGASVGTGTLAVKRLKAEGLSDTDARALLQAALVDAEPDAEFVWVDAVFDDVVVYTARVEDEPSQTFERAYTRDGDAFQVGEERTEVVPQVSYQPVGKDDDGGGLKLVDQLRITTLDVDAAILRVLDAVDARGKRGRDLGGESKAEAIAMAESFRELDRVAKQLRGMATELLPEDQAVRAVAKFLATDALRLGV